MKKNLFITLIALVMCGLVLMGGIPADAGAQPKKLTVIATTDLHGALDRASLLASYVRILREKNSSAGPVVFVDAGDMLKGSLISDLAEGEPVVRFFNYLGLDASALGNHEFDYGPVGPAPVPQKPGDDPFGALKARIAEEHFPVLAANVVGPDGKIPAWLKPSVMIERDGVKIGIVGAADEKTAATTMHANVRELTFQPPDEPVKREAENLRQQGADFVILLAHFGGGCRDNRNPDSLSTCDWEDLFRLVKGFRPGLVDVVVAGHTHRGIAKRIGRTAILEPFFNGKYLAWAEVSLPNSNPPAVFGPVAIVPDTVFLGSTIKPDAGTDSLLAADFDQVWIAYNRPLNVEVTAEFPHPPKGENALGNMVADLLRSLVPGSNIGLINNGGLRNSLPAGPLVYGKLYDVMFFDNLLSAITVSGETVEKLVVLGLTNKEGFSWSGLTFKAKDCAVRIRVGGKPLNPKKIYRIATVDFLATGGSGVDSLHISPQNVTILDVLAREAVVKKLEARKRALYPAEYFSASKPRQKITGTCTKPPWIR